LGGRPQIEAGLRALIRQMSMENPLWGAPRIHGELLKLGFEIAQSSVAKYMVKRRGPPGQGWLTFLRNHAPDIAAMSDRIFPISANAFRLAWGRVKSRAGIDDLNFHDLRHEAISRFFEMGMTIPEVASISGHRDARMLFRYAHAERQSVLRKLDQHSHSL
jgi:integrase